MRLLLDANLSWRLIRLLSTEFEYVEHVERCGLPIPASDPEIWDWAKDNDAMIVTNDEDYYYFSLQKGFPPKVILLRIGNQSTGISYMKYLPACPGLNYPLPFYPFTL